MTSNIPTAERELPADQRVALAGPKGRLNPAAAGWSRRPIHDCAIAGRWPRKKRWNYWCFTSETHLFSITAASLDYAAMFFAYYLDFETGEFIEDTVTVPLALGCAMPDTVEGHIHHSGHGIDLTMTTEGNATDIQAHWVNFGGHPMSCEFTVRPAPDHESLNVVIPWSEKHFQFTSKQECLPAHGRLSIGERDILFEEEATFGCLDFGRGVWPYRCVWNWGAASGVEAGRTIGLNFGGQWTDGTGHTENGIVVDGRLHKISEDVRFDYDRSDYMSPWRVATIDSDRVDLSFTPFFERVAASNLGLIQSEVHQMIGYYSGPVQLSDGSSVTVERLLGWAEDHHARW